MAANQAESTRSSSSLEEFTELPTLKEPCVSSFCENLAKNKGRSFAVILVVFMGFLAVLAIILHTRVGVKSENSPRAHQKLENFDSIEINDLEALNSLDASTQSVTIVALRGWPPTTTSPHGNRNPVTTSSTTCPKLTQLIIQGKLSEEMLLTVVRSFSETLTRLVLDVQRLCLGARVSVAELANITITGLELPSVQRLTLLNSNGCPLTPWILGWKFPVCTTVDFRGSYVDEATFRKLEEMAGAGTGANGLRNLILHDTELCIGCRFSTPNLVNISNCRTKEEP